MKDEFEYLVAKAAWVGVFNKELVSLGYDLEQCEILDRLEGRDIYWQIVCKQEIKSEGITGRPRFWFIPDVYGVPGFGCGSTWAGRSWHYQFKTGLEVKKERKYT